MQTRSMASHIPSSSGDATFTSAPAASATATATAAPAASSPPQSNTTVKLDNIKPLTGIDNYEVWSSQVSLVLFAIGAKDLVVHGTTPIELSPERVTALLQQALLIIIQLVSEPILAQIASLNTAHAMWVYLRENYFSDTSNSPTDSPSVVSVPSTIVSAHITEHADVLMADVDVSPSQWKFDTGSSAHMTDQIGQFICLTPHHGIVRVGGNSELRSEGVGTVLLSCLSTDSDNVDSGVVTSVRLNNVLYVPTLGHSLLSWNQIKNKCHLIAHGSKMTISTSDNTPIFDIEFRGSLPYVVLSTSTIASNAPNSPHIAHNTALSVNAQNPLNSASTKAHFWHVPKRAISLLGRLGITISYTSINRILKDSAHDCLSEVVQRAAFSGDPFGVVYDNLVFSKRVSGETVLNKESMEKMTVNAMYFLRINTVRAEQYDNLRAALYDGFPGLPRDLCLLQTPRGSSVLEVLGWDRGLRYWSKEAESQVRMVLKKRFEKETSKTSGSRGRYLSTGLNLWCFQPWILIQEL